MRFMIIGEGALVVQCADRLLQRDQTVGGVVSDEAQVVAWAERHDVPVVPFGDDLVPFLSREPFDYLLSVVNLRMLPEEVLALPRKMAINFHDSPLPRYAGLYATTWALLHGEEEHGVTWHEMTAGADEGRVLKQRRFDVAPGETAFSLNAKCFTAGIESFDELADELARDALAPVAQAMAERTYFGRYDRPGASCVADLAAPAAEVARLVTALDLGEAYPNPIGVPRFRAGDRWFFARAAEVVDGSGAPGAILDLDDDGVVVAAQDGAVRLTRLCAAGGDAVPPRALGLAEGGQLTVLDDALRARLEDVAGRATRAESSWRRHLLGADPLAATLGAGAGGDAEVALDDDARAWLAGGDAAASHALAAAACGLLGRLAGAFDFRVGLVHDRLREDRHGLEGLFASTVPLRLPLDDDAPVAAAVATVAKRLGRATERGPLFTDLFAREPALEGVARVGDGPAHPVVLDLTSSVDDARPAPGSAVTVVVAADGSRLRVLAGDGAALDVAGFAARLASFVSALAGAPDTKLGRVPILTPAERELLVDEINRTARDLPEDATVLSLIEEQARRTPDAPAVSSADRTLSYRELDERANALAHRLVDAGVARGDRVGVLLERSERLEVSVLAVMKAGAAYVPLDPAYPRDRLELMAEDAQLSVIVTEEACAADVPGASDVTAVRVDEDEEARRADAPAARPAPGDLAYVIYTSGSTGRPKGVMVEHRNAVAFFVAMDERLGTDPGVWLAVTSLSFDISVLELLWTLARGFHVVVYAGDDRKIAAVPGPYANETVDFSAFYFSSDASEAGLSGKYQLLLEGARFADSHGFAAVWTPERHFHAFGGLYPNPSVTSAAVATITENVGLRAGSCVSPLHSPIRVAEEWSVVDNLSGGRVGISFASGWQPNDFVLKPDAFANRKQQMFDDIETVRALWRGESVTFRNGTGDDVEVSILPRPVQPELPVWVTAAGNPETFAGAARAGCHVLTHLLGQSVDEVAEKIALYRKTWREAGHEGEGVISLMLHTFVGPDRDAVKEIVREPMKQYLSSAVGLIKAAAWSFPTFKQQTTLDDGTFGTDHLSAEEMDALLEHAFERYYATSGLFGDPRRAQEVAAQAAAIGVDDVACLIDFGVATPLVLEHLPWLDEVRQAFARTPGRRAAPEGFDGTVAGLIERHGVTHLQCTPSMASMLLADERTRGAVRGLKRFCVGGEALPVALAEQLAALVEGEVHNMYGPTETTIWSTTWPVKDVNGAVPIGTPIANTQVYVVDRRLELVPPGTPGELCIGGRAVVRGYLDRPELTAERFPPDPWSDAADARLYRTGDLVRWRDDGQLEFLGRLDHQVKIRGYRMELGEIETVLASRPDVKQAVVIAREDTPGDKRLVAYLRAEGGGVDEDALRAHAEAQLPEYMVPSAFVVMAAFPETPNRKVDRKAFPPPEELRPKARGAFVAPSSGTEELIAGVWREVLGVDEVGVNDNFFDLGGHSLLTIQVLNRLKEHVEQPLSLVDLFRLPTIRALTEHLASGPDEEGLKESAARGDRRREAMKRRAQRRRR